MVSIFGGSGFTFLQTVLASGASALCSLSDPSSTSFIVFYNPIRFGLRGGRRKAKRQKQEVEFKIKTLDCMYVNVGILGVVNIHVNSISK